MSFGGPLALGALGLASAVRAGEVSPVEVVEACLDAIAENDDVLHCFNTVTGEAALAQARQLEARLRAGEEVGPLAGVPIALKDNLCTRGVETTCSSRILAGWRPPYDATVVTRVKEAGAIVVGKTNLDEFAMGSSTETSATGPTRNPWDTTRVPGGSSGGSAAAVAAGLVPLALGSDTGGSIRQPAALCGVVGIKPTYGLVSRYGLVAFASSLDQVGPFATSVEDAAALLEVLAGHDPADSTSLQVPASRLRERLGVGVDGLRVGLITDFLADASAACAAAVRSGAQALASAGARVEEVAIPELLDGLSAYYLIAPAEASSNLARYDGVRYGLRVEGDDVAEMNARTRAAGFGDEVKRRIMLGTYVLSAGYYDAYYAQAQRVRTRIIHAFARAYEGVDVLLAPTAPSVAFELGSKLDDPLEMYLSDLFTIPTNLAGHPAMSVPFSLGDGGLPVGLQVLAPALGEAVMCQVGAVLESLADPGARGPVSTRVHEP
jgi:aspartyl-tRNA(Asn)/glutamyl-tRNA(Gln) amidotransferase subunit A